MKVRWKFRATAALLALSAPALIAGAHATTVVSEGSAPQSDGFQLSTVVSGLEHPWGMAWLPDGTMLVTERPGRLRIIRDGALSETEVTGVPEVLAERQGGLLDVAVHPDFAENRLVYLTYAHGMPGANRTRIARAVLDGEALVDLEVIFEVAEEKPDTQHFGSRLLWLPDGTLLASIGDGGNPPVAIDGDLIRVRAQDVSSALGKTVRFNDDGSIPEDNPFIDGDGVAPFVWSYGHRNIQGLAADAETGAVWANEHGALAGDELNRIARGENFGWPLATYSRDYRGATEISPHTSLPDMTDPTLVWMDTQAPSGLAIYRGDRFPDWRGDLFSGSLVAEEIRQIRIDDAGLALDERSIPIGARVRDVHEGPDGYLYVLTDEPDGALIRIEPTS